jgi:hypothetical protein
MHVAASASPACEMVYAPSDPALAFQTWFAAPLQIATVAALPTPWASPLVRHSVASCVELPLPTALVSALVMVPFALNRQPLLLLHGVGEPIGVHPLEQSTSELCNWQLFLFLTKLNRGFQQLNVEELVVTPLRTVVSLPSPGFTPLSRNHFCEDFPATHGRLAKRTHFPPGIDAGAGGDNAGATGVGSGPLRLPAPATISAAPAGHSDQNSPRGGFTL